MQNRHFGRNERMQKGNCEMGARQHHCRTCPKVQRRLKGRSRSLVDQCSMQASPRNSQRTRTQANSRASTKRLDEGFASACMDAGLSTRRAHPHDKLIARVLHEPRTQTSCRTERLPTHLPCKANEPQPRGRPTPRRATHRRSSHNLGKEPEARANDSPAITRSLAHLRYA